MFLGSLPQNLLLFPLEIVRSALAPLPVGAVFLSTNVISCPLYITRPSWARLLVLVSTWSSYVLSGTPDTVSCPDTILLPALSSSSLMMGILTHLLLVQSYLRLLLVLYDAVPRRFLAGTVVGLVLPSSRCTGRLRNPLCPSDELASHCGFQL